MNEIEFKNWMLSNGMKKKVASDTISRLKRVERTIESHDIDIEYKNDECEELLSLLKKNRINDTMMKYPQTDLPIGKYTMSSFRYAIKKYINFLNSNKKTVH